MTYFRCDVCGHIHEPFCSVRKHDAWLGWYSEARSTALRPYREEQELLHKYWDNKPTQVAYKPTHTINS